MNRSKSRIRRPQNPYANANLFSRASFWWIRKLFRQGFQAPLKDEDLYEIPEKFDANNSTILLDKLWKEEKQKQIKTNLLRVIIKAYGKRFIPISVLLYIVGVMLKWIRKLFRQGFQAPLKDEDLYEIPEKFDANNSTILLDKLWKEEKEKQIKPNLLRVILKAYGKRFIPISVLLYIVGVMLKSMQPLFLGGLVSFFAAGQTDINENQAFLYATGVVTCSFLIVLITQTYIKYGLEMSSKIRIAISGLIYRKCLQISKNSLDNGLRGRAINILANDLSFDLLFCFLHDWWKGPLEAIIFGYLMYREIGVAAVIGFTFMLSFIPLQIWGAKKAAGYKQKIVERSDLRVKLMNEIIQGIQVIKMYAWETSFGKVIDAVRRKEVTAFKGYFYILASLASTYMIVPLSIFLALMSSLYFGQVLTAMKIFTVSAYFTMLNDSMIRFWPISLIYLAETWISLKRCNEFLLCKEQQERFIEGEEKSDDEMLLEKFPSKLGKRIVNLAEKQKGIELNNIVASWETKKVEVDPQNTLALKNVSINFKDTNFSAIVGPVGSGKSTLLNTILGEIHLDSGEIFINGKISYCSQEPWIFDGSIKDNIIFVEELNDQRYRQVLKVCSLERDLDMWPKRDLTRVGERGVCLSGGQRARINLARAIYRKADIYLLDDPLSAVDTHVGKHIVDNCIKTFLDSKICILVTHQLQYLMDCQHLILMESGQIIAQDSYTNLQKSQQFKFITQTQNNSMENGNICDDKININDDENKTLRSRSASEHLKETDSNNKKAAEIDNDEDLNKETQAAGSVNLNIYWSYFEALDNMILLFTIFGLFITARFLLNGMDYFLSRWVIWEEKIALNSQAETNSTAISRESIDHNQHRQKLVIIYFSVLSATLIVYILRTFGFFRMCLQISLQLHDQLLRAIIRTSMLFFNTNPSGRILNRFSKDIRTLDMLLPQALMDCLACVVDVFGVIIIVSIVNFWLLIPFAMIFLCLMALQKVYVNTSRSLKRLESISQSPIYSLINQTFQGLTTIRAFQAETVLEAEFFDHQNSNTSAWFLFFSTNRAFSMWTDILCVCFTTIVTFSFLLFHAKFNSGDVGLAILQSCTLVNLCQRGIRQSADLENHMTSVERVMEYINLPSESVKKPSEELKSSITWPTYGRIEFINFNFKYLPYGMNILKGLNFTIEPKEKIGIVGRTGAGKSSIIQSLFRLAHNDGIIRIDNIDIETLDLNVLRSKISIIPQDPVLFSGTLRYNLDPLQEYGDEQMWQALKEVELKEHVTKSMGGLSCVMSEGGSNFSVGQRQLLCLARAVLRQNKILILDEATANVDPITDNLIQTTIRTKLSECTVLTIAHRLHTVMDSDRVLVMDAGQAVELGHPYELLQKQNGFLRNLVDDTGADEAAALLHAANKQYKSKTDACDKEI